MHSISGGMWRKRCYHFRRGAYLRDLPVPLQQLRRAIDERTTASTADADPRPITFASVRTRHHGPARHVDRGARDSPGWSSARCGQRTGVLAPADIPRLDANGALTVPARAAPRPERAPHRRFPTAARPRRGRVDSLRGTSCNPESALSLRRHDAMSNYTREQTGQSSHQHHPRDGTQCPPSDDPADHPKDPGGTCEELPKDEPPKLDEPKKCPPPPCCCPTGADLDFQLPRQPHRGADDGDRRSGRRQEVQGGSGGAARQGQGREARIHGRQAQEPSRRMEEAGCRDRRSHP